MDSRKFKRWAIYAVLAVANILILVTAFRGNLAVKSPAQAKSVPAGSTKIYLPIVYRAPDPLSILSNFTSYQEREADTQFLHIVGEVKNQDGSGITDINIEAHLFDRKGNEVGFTVGHPALPDVPAGAKTCFHLVSELPDGYDSYELKLAGFKTQPDLPQMVDTYITNSRFDKDFGWYAVNGVATYQAGKISGDASVSATFYDRKGRVIGCEQAFAAFPDSEIAEPGIFAFYLMSPNASKVETVSTLAVTFPSAP